MTHGYRYEKTAKKIKLGVIRFTDLSKIATIHKGSFFWKTMDVKSERTIEGVIRQVDFLKLNFTRTYIKRQINEMWAIAMLENCGDCAP